MTHRRLLLVSTLLMGSALTSAVAAEPEYIEARSPISTDLEDASAPIEGLDTNPDSYFQPGDLTPLFPDARLPPESLIDWTGEAFWEDMTLKFLPRAYYFHRKFESGNVAEATTNGGARDLQTGWYRDFLRFRFTGFTSQKIAGKLSEDGTGNLAPGQSPYTVLGVATAELKIWDAVVFGGRTELNLPYINGKDSRMTPNTFEGLGFHYGEKGKDPLRFGLAHLTQIKFRTSSDFVSFSEQAGAPIGDDGGVTAVALRYDINDDAYIGFTNDYGWNTFNTFYTEGQYFFELGNGIGLRVGAQFTHQDSVGDEWLGSFSTYGVGARAGLEFCDFVLSASINKTGDGGDILAPWGGSPTYRSLMISDEDRAGETAVTLALAYDFSQVGLKGLSSKVSWLSGNTPDFGPAASPDEKELSVTVDYRPPVECLENLWLRCRWAKNDRAKSQGGQDREDVRVILDYAMEF